MLTTIRVASKSGTYSDLAVNVENPHLPNVGENLVYNNEASNGPVVSRQFEYVLDSSGPSPIYILYVNLFTD